MLNQLSYIKSAPLAAISERILCTPTAKSLSSDAEADFDKRNQIGRAFCPPNWMGDFDREGGSRRRSGGVGGSGGAADTDWDRTTQEFLRSISRGEQQQRSTAQRGGGSGGGAEVT